MIPRDELQQLPVHGPSLIANTLWGRRTTTTPATITLSLVSGAESDSKLWRLLSFLLVPMAGASGGALYCLTADQLRHVGSTEKLLAGFISLLF